MIELSGVSRTFVGRSGAVEALRGIDLSVKVGEFEIAPVMQTRSLRAFSCRQTLPIRWLKRIGNLGSRACDQSLLAPGSKHMG